ncbi:tyrosine--tRNA ligase [Candidatus Gottesmanbacteria bacterium]|nr:tyrosine--tRNA ligase [Candidatus Gottesmanbacteria bacterium]
MDAIKNLLTRGVDKIYPSREALEKVLRSGKKLRLYQGFDPSGNQLHIGHAVAMRKLRQFQELGHHVIFLIGDFTGLIGDPSGKGSQRKKMTREEVLTNAKNYQTQASKILRFDGKNPVEIKFNNEWLSKLTFEELIDIASHFTVQQMIERNMFQERIKRKDDIGLHEFFYPLMQGYDSVAMEVDLELGGTDQTFNMLAGRKLVSQILHKEKFVMTVPLLTDAKGVKIGKTEGNVIGITDPPNEFFGKVMALGDDAIIPCFTLLTDTPIEEIKKIKEKMERGENPMAFKKQLAFELTKQFNDDASAKIAQKEFETRFQNRNVSQASLPLVSNAALPSGATVADAIVAFGLASSKSEAKRLIEQNAVKRNGLLVTIPKEFTKFKPGEILEVGRKAVKIEK